MQYQKTFGAIFLFISVLTLYQRGDAAAVENRETRQTKGPNNSDTTQADVKTLNGQLLLGGQMTNQPQGLIGFGGVIDSMPYARYNGLAYAGSGYPGSTGMGLIGLPFGNRAGVGIGTTPGISSLQLGSNAGLGFTPTANYVGNNLPPYPLNSPEMYGNPMFATLPQPQSNFGSPLVGVNNFDNLVNMGNMPGIIGNGSPNSLLGGQMQPTQLQLQAQATQLQPQFGAAFPHPSVNYGQMSGYGPAPLQAIQGNAFF